MNVPIRLLLSDVDGTLVPHDKVLTARSIQAVKDLHDAGILFALTSSRPPRGMRMFVEALNLATPISAFNGAMIMDAHGLVLHERKIDDDVVPVLLATLEEYDVSTWVYRDQEWYVLDADGPHVRHEAEVCQFEPLTVANFSAVSDGVAKIVGTSDDVSAMTSAREAIQAKVGSRVSATNSQSYYLDITSPEANKGAAVDFLAVALEIPAEAIATIGDAHNDVSMFERSGLSIAMGNAEADVQASAKYVTTSNEDEGFANAVDQFILMR